MKILIKLGIRLKLFLLSLLIIAGNGFMGYSVYKSNQKLYESEQCMLHSEKVIYLTSNILSFGKDVEIESRGFVITNDSNFLNPQLNPVLIFVKAEQLKQLFQDNKAQQLRVDTLTFYLQKYIDFSTKAIELRSTKGLASAVSLIITKQGKEYIDRICIISNEINSEETKLLNNIKSANENTIAELNRISAIMFILMVVFTILLLVIIGNTLTKNKEKEKRAAELVIANKELDFQNEEKEKRAAELFIANKELTFQNEEKEKRAAELFVANNELAFQNGEKEKRAAELVIANTELVYQNHEKDNRAAELIIANKELAFQNEEKGKRAAELIIADKEIIIQQLEKDKQEAANKELEAFSYSVSHDLRAPLRHIGGFIDLLIKSNSAQLDANGLRYLNIISESSHEMGNLIDALLSFSRLSRTELIRTTINSKDMVNRVLKTFSDELVGRNIEINIAELPYTIGDEALIYQVWVNLISNALKYSKNKEKAIISIGGKIENDKTVFFIKDNGAGFDMKFSDKLFGVFQRLHKARDFEGIGIGLANVNRIIVRHGGVCWAESEVDKGATFYFSLLNH